MSQIPGAIAIKQCLFRPTLRASNWTNRVFPSGILAQCPGTPDTGKCKGLLCVIPRQI